MALTQKMFTLLQFVLSKINDGLSSRVCPSRLSSHVLHSLTPLTRWTNIQDKATFFGLSLWLSITFLFSPSMLSLNPSKTQLHFLLSQENIFMLQQISILSSAPYFLHLLELTFPLCPLCCLYVLFCFWGGIPSLQVSRINSLFCT